MPAQPECDSPTATRRKREIAMAARAEIVAKGVEGLRMRGVADRVGINIATLDYHVSGKDGLFALIAESIVDDFKSQFHRTYREDASGLERLAQEIRDFREIRVSIPDIAPVLGALTRRAATDPGMAAHMVPMRAKWTGMIAGIMQQGRDDGSLRAQIDPEAAAALFIWALLGMGGQDRPARSFPQLAAELMRAYAADPSQDFEGLFA